MAEGGGAETRRTDANEPGPGVAFIPFMLNEDLMDKLKILNYEKDFCPAYDIPPFSRHHFALPADSSQQFYHFASLVGWMLSMLGAPMERVQEYDDPNATVAKVIGSLKTAGVPTNFPPAKLKQGHGSIVMQVLDTLSENCLQKSKWKWNMPRHDDEGGGEPDIDDMDEDIDDETAEVKIGKGGEFDDITDETTFADGSDGEDDDVGAVGLGGNKLTMMDDSAMPQHKEALISKADATEWKLEVERVLPSLKIHIRADEKDWRVHRERIDKHTGEIDTQLIETKQHLTRLHDDISKAIEKMASREKYVNSQLGTQLNEFRLLNDTSSEAKARYNSSNGGVTSLTRELSAMTDELDTTKAQMEEFGQSLSDAAPLVKLKQSLTQLKVDIGYADVRAGVLTHILSAYAMSKKIKLQKELNISRPGLLSDTYGEFNTV